MLCVGSAVGMANVWGFPYKLGSNGGGAFLLIYILFVILFGYVGLSAEYAIGRRSGTGTLGSYAYAWKHGRKDLEGIGKIIGWLPLAGSITIAIGYAVIIAYVLKAFTQSVLGSIMTVEPGQWFESFAFQQFSVVPYHAVIIIVTLLTIVLGAVSWFWVMKKDELLDEINTGAKKHYGNGWYYLGKYVYTLFALFLCVVALVRGEGF